MGRSSLSRSFTSPFFDPRNRHRPGTRTPSRLVPVDISYRSNPVTQIIKYDSPATRSAGAEAADAGRYTRLVRFPLFGRWLPHVERVFPLGTVYEQGAM